MEPRFIFGVDLDGVVSDFYSFMREVTSEWLGVDINQLTVDVSYGLPEWGLEGMKHYERLHRFALTQRNLFKEMQPINGSPQMLRCLSSEGIRIRIITHRLFIARFHKQAILQTVKWLDYHDIPYWDLCFMQEKGSVGADLYIEDSPNNIKKLKEEGKRVIIYTNSTNRDLPGERAGDWTEAGRIVRKYYYTWLREKERPAPEKPCHPPEDKKEHSPYGFEAENR